MKILLRGVLSIGLFACSITGFAKGWQDYVFLNPASGQMEPKSMYIEKFEDLIVGCGIYRSK